jgi:hypothetical protein
LSRNLQPGIHPDADQLSVFVEGTATAREQKLMLAHLAECWECRKAAFLMRPHEEPQPDAMTPEQQWAWRGWTWRWLIPVGVPAAALACALIVMLIYIRPHGGRLETPQPIASVRQPEIEPPGTTAAPTTKSERAPSTNSEQSKRSGRRQSRFTPNAPPANVSRQENHVVSGLTLPRSKSNEPTANVTTPQTTVAAEPASAPTSDGALPQNAVSYSTTSDLPLNGRNVANMQQPQSADTKAAASQTGLANKKDLPALEIERASGQVDTVAGLSGRITDRSGAVILGATVTLRDAAGKTRQTMTGADGSFHLTELPPGQYELTATATGFKTSTQSIELKSNEVAMLQTVLDVGAVAETVEVEAGAVSVQTESASVGRFTGVPSGLPVASTVSRGKRLLSLDSAGNLFLSRNGRNKWKKIKPQWAGKAVRIELTTEASGDASVNAKDEIGGATERAVFQLTTDAGTTWSSEDGLHWRQR